MSGQPDSPPSVRLCDTCPLNATVNITIAAHERRINQHDADIRKLLDHMAGVDMLMKLSIGGGGISIITLILTLADLIRHATP